jgi:hypothetical protein
MKRWFFALSAAGLSVLTATAALALWIVLPPAGTVHVPPTTAAAQPVLDGLVIHDALVPFSIKAPTGATLCEGNLQDRVVRSAKSGLYDFYYRIRDTKGSGAIGRFYTSSFAGLPLRVAYRTDGLGAIAPTVAKRTAAPGALIGFAFGDPVFACSNPAGSRFILIATNTKAFRPGGITRIFTTSGAQAVLTTVEPQP